MLVRIAEWLMVRLLEKLLHSLSLDTEEGAAGVEYAVIGGLIVGGLLVWWFR